MVERLEKSSGLNKLRIRHLAPVQLILMLTRGKRAVLSSEKMKDSLRVVLRVLDLELTRMMTIEK